MCRNSNQECFFFLKTVSAAENDKGNVPYVREFYAWSGNYIHTNAK